MITPNAPHFSTPEGGEQPLSDLFMVRSPTRPTTWQAEGEMTERHKFEAFFAESRRNRGAKKRPNFDTLADGTYADEHTQRHWWTWQSARRAGQGSPAVDREELLGDAIRALIAGSIKCSDDLPSDRRPVHVSARRAFGAVHEMLRLGVRPAAPSPAVAITAEMVHRLRDDSDHPMMECKRALQVNGGDMDRAKEWLRQPAHLRETPGALATRLSRPAPPGSPVPLGDFEAWLKENRDAKVSAVIGDVLVNYRAALAPEARQDALHIAICQAVAICNRSPEMAASADGRQVIDILRNALANFADEAQPVPRVSDRP